MLRLISLNTALLLAACGGDDSPSKPRPAPVPGWSVGAPDAVPAIGTTFTIRQRVNAITRPCDLQGKSRITMRVTLDGELVTATPPVGPGLLTLYFQRKGDDWSARGEKEAYRWYATASTVTTSGTGTYVLAANLSDRWTAVETSDSWNNAQAFADAVANCERVGVVLGGGTGYGHGVTGPATLTINSFTVE